MTGVPVNIQRQRPAGESNTRTSGYFILINSNKQRNTLTQAAADSYRAAVEQFVQGEFRSCINFVGDDGASWSKKWINKVDISYAHERGPKGNRVVARLVMLALVLKMRGYASANTPLIKTMTENNSDSLHPAFAGARLLVLDELKPGHVIDAKQLGSPPALYRETLRKIGRAHV